VSKPLLADSIARLQPLFAAWRLPSKYLCVMYRSAFKRPQSAAFLRQI